MIVSTWHKNYSTFVLPAFTFPYIQLVKTIVSYDVMTTNIYNLPPSYEVPPFLYTFYRHKWTVL